MELLPTDFESHLCDFAASCNESHKTAQLFYFQCDMSRIVFAMHRMKKHKSRKRTATKTATRFHLFLPDFIIFLGGL